MNDVALLHEYVVSRSERAFAELVHRHLAFVQATALRLARNRHAADELAQTVFIQLARKPPMVCAGQTLPGWLYRTTQHAFLMNLRGESRRRLREAEAVSLLDLASGRLHVAEQLAPLLEDALGRLNHLEQQAVLLRFFHSKSFAEIGLVLGLNEDAARKRVKRSLEKMRGFFARAGVAMPKDPSRPAARCETPA
jgi:RNA polymerase sigma factor (sigma-70 family)